MLRLGPRAKSQSATHEAFCPILQLQGLEQCHRIFNCIRCSRQVIICRECDRGDIYCSAACAAAQRKRSLKQAGERYQNSFVGRRQHAERQARYRARHSAAKKKVTHHGSTTPAKCGSRNMVTTAVPRRLAAHPSLRTSSPDLICDKCHHSCGTLSRHDFWRGGRRRMRYTRRGHIKGDGSGDNPSEPG